MLNNIDNSWKIIFDEYNKNYKENSLEKILIKLEVNLKVEDKDKDYNVFPKIDNIFRCFTYFSFNETKIVILGQDPYHSPNQATGLCFGIEKDVPVPPSLRNIKKELQEDLDITITDNSLEKWAKQGILLLNASLSVIQGKPNSQAKLWNEFTKFLINRLNDCEHSIIFVAWGAFAHEKFKNIDLNKHKLIISSHPSPLSVYKKYKIYPAFSRSKPFSKINEILKNNNQTLIEW